MSHLTRTAVLLLCAGAAQAHAPIAGDPGVASWVIALLLLAALLYAAGLLRLWPIVRASAQLWWRAAAFAAGWMALSRDRGTQRQAVDQAYGLVCNVEGEVMEDMIVAQANQEHGIITVRPGTGARLPDLPVGTRLRILPNHACATGAQFDEYAVLPAEAGARLALWPRFRGW